MTALDELAYEIADEQCASIIECYGVRVRDRRGHILWYAVDVNGKFGGWQVSRALCYLKARGMLRRHAKHSNWVKVKP
jgi:hypothetical protein